MDLPLGLDWFTLIVVWLTKSAINLIVQSLPRLEETESRWGRLGIRAVHALADNFPLAATGKPKQTPIGTGRHLVSQLRSLINKGDKNAGRNT